MTKETRLAVGIVAGVLVIVAGWLWLGQGEDPVQDDLQELSSLEQPAVPAYEEYTDPDDGKDLELDDQSGDVTQIIVRTGATTDDNVEIEQVLANKVVIDGEVVQHPGE
ncbi:hypothetical protein M3P05_06560 [Sansalvadorimonas sp. 2012CJ34-2]|uniref:Uncharacterized protein n=1 Tax=Parendozoicomonas callyspongiae TaxID=2942213 RepID=A0ABT0PEC1_9GAMM|nr:hypothetical protein [Sansalvadorimonas sp. 2012CJ34-2]MCL6269601.1 hypothetical protein [Sansalvadorimonas sp. 2012CJ34-2]